MPLPRKRIAKRIYKGGVRTIPENKKGSLALSLYNRNTKPFSKLLNRVFHVTVSKHSVVKKGEKVRGLIARSQFDMKKMLWLGGKDFSEERWLFYPQLKHFSLFEKASKEVRDKGPSEEFPGAVGSISIERTSHQWKIRYMQSHFKQGKPKELTRSIATQYGGWRHRLLDAVFKQAIKEKVKEITFDIDYPLSEDEHINVNTQSKIFSEIAEKNRFSVNIFKVKDATACRAKYKG